HKSSVERVSFWLASEFGTFVTPRVCVYTCVYVCVCMHLCSCVRVCVSACVRLSSCVRVCVSACVCEGERHTRKTKGKRKNEREAFMCAAIITDCRKLHQSANEEDCV